MHTKAFVFVLAAGTVFTSLAFQDQKPPAPWPVADAAKNKKNPVPANSESLATGKELWNTHCKSCHGAKGLGDGSKSSQLKTQAGNFSKPEVQSETDGELYYKISEGRGDMPAFKKKIPDEEERWSIVDYMRTFKK
jgi:mono/diheme cytochrome c family protein